MCIAQAIKFANSADPKDIRDALENNTFERWGSFIKFEPIPGPHWHQASPPVLILQYKVLNQAVGAATIIYPLDKATGKYTPPSELHQ
jgi:hypothetical protein